MHEVATLQSGLGIALGGLGLAGAGVAALASWVTFAPGSSYWYPVVRRGPAHSSEVALTFDDGPWTGATESILDTLAATRVSAMFFVIGRNAASRPDLLKRIREEGHLLGNHSYDHDHFGIVRGPAYWLEQLDRTDEVIASASGERPALFRPPMGFKSRHMASALRSRGHRAIAWSRRAFDGVNTTPERIAARLSGCRAGDIVALHDGVDPHLQRDPGSTVLALARVIDSLRSQGLEPVRLDRLLGLDPYR